MFEDWKQAWRDAVANFERELAGDDAVEGDAASAAAAGAHTREMQRQLATARGALARLDTEIERAAEEAGAEREAEAVCRRRGTLAAGIDDQETVRIAAEFAERHATRATVLERKTAVLREERELLVSDLDRMHSEIGARANAAAEADAAGEIGADDDSRLELDEEERERQAWQLNKLRRERAADERLEELKRRMRG